MKRCAICSTENFAIQKNGRLLVLKEYEGKDYCNACLERLKASRRNQKQEEDRKAEAKQERLL